MHDNDSRTADRTNSSTARYLADVASALGELDHLPALSVVCVSSYPNVAVRAGVAGWDDDEIRAIALWARAFASPLVIDLSDDVEVRTTVTIGRFTLIIARNATRDSAGELCRRLGLDPAGGVIEVSPHTLLATLDPDLTALDPQAEDRSVYAHLAGIAAYAEPDPAASTDGATAAETVP